LRKEELDALATTLSQMLAQGAEPGMPMGVPLGSLGQLVHTAPEETPAEPVVEAIPADAADRPRLVLPV
jgi:hypothetical protein